MSIAVAFLQGIAGGLLIVLFFAVIVGGALLAATVFGRTYGRRPDQPRERLGRSLLLGRVLCAAGLAFAVIGVFFVSVATDVVGIVLGMTGYYLGSRVFGVVVIIISMVTLLVGLSAGQGAIPGSYDEIMNGFERPSER